MYLADSAHGRTSVLRRSHDALTYSAWAAVDNLVASACTLEVNGAWAGAVHVMPPTGDLAP